MTQRRLKDGSRPRIGVSLDPDVYEWIQSMKGPSDSYKVSRILRAAMLAGVKIDEAESTGTLKELCDWLAKKKRNKYAAELRELLEEFLSG